MSRAIGEVAEQASQAGLVLIFMVFLLLGRKGTPSTGLLGEIETRVKRFVTRIVFFSVLLYKWTGGQFFLPAGGWGLDDHLIMPAVTLALLPIAYTARLTRASTLETIRQDYIRTAWAKGLSERLVVIRHILKNSLIPVVTTLGPTFAFLVTGSVIVETVFSIPGIGRAFVVAVTSRDYPMILGTTVLFSVIIAAANLVVDVLYVFIDPRVRLT